MTDDRIRIKCTKCSGVFGVRAQRVRPNSELNCQHCDRLIIFQHGSEDSNIRRALACAKNIRFEMEMPKPKIEQR